MKVFIKYSNKFPYLPEAVADSKEELARILGKRLNLVESSISKGYKTYKEIEIGNLID